MVTSKSKKRVGGVDRVRKNATKKGQPGRPALPGVGMRASGGNRTRMNTKIQDRNARGVKRTATVATLDSIRLEKEKQESKNESSGDEGENNTLMEGSERHGIVESRVSPPNVFKYTQQEIPDEDKGDRLPVRVGGGLCGGVDTTRTVSIFK